MNATSPRARQLPPGRHGLATDHVAANQRSRILAAVVSSVGSVGYRAATVEQIVTEAGVSRKTFYQHFANKDEVFLAAYDDGAGRIIEQVEREYAAHDDFASSVRASLDNCLRAFAAEPDLAKMLVVEVFAAGTAALARRNEILSRLTGLIEERTRDLAFGTPGSRLTVETIVGGVLEVIYNRVQGGEAHLLPELLPDLLFCVLSPFLGHEKATVLAFSDR